MATSVSVGGNVDAWCTKCKMVLAHTVEAMVGSAPKRVQCNTCHGQHVFKASKPGTGTRRTRAASTTTATGRPQAQSLVRASDYTKFMEGRDPANARRYSPKSIFRTGDLVEHPRFGMGVTTSIKDRTKIEVLFEDGPRVLIHAR